MFETLDELLKWKPPDIPEVISSGLLPVGGKLVLAGDEGTFKTMLTTYACFCISLGLPFLGFKTAKVRVGFMQAELTKAMFRERIDQLVKAHNSNLRTADIMFSTQLELKVNKPHGLAMLINGVKAANIKLLALDPIYKVLQGDISDWSEMMKMLDGLDYISRSTGCSIWLVHHGRKHQTLDGEIIDMGTDELIGSSALKDWADSIIRIKCIGDDLLRMSFPKVRNAKNLIQPMEIKFNRSTLSFSMMEV